ncbi:MAG: endonuclease III [Rhodothermales bacterium]|nr:endonuclease III [Rhodothermales bacterium]
MGRKENARTILARLSAVISQPVTELVHRNPYELLVAVILSAQCTDERVNQVTPELFDAYPDVASLAEATSDEIRPFIASITFPNNKARHLEGMARRVMGEYGGSIPRDIKGLQTLPGVGRKTAQVVAGAAFGVASMPVDTHVFRVAHRLGLARAGSDTPDTVEQDLRRLIPEEDLSVAHHLFILHGRYTCTARSPTCGACSLADLCPQWDRVKRLPDPIRGLSKKKGRFWCGTRKHYVDHTVPRVDRTGVRQESCPRCGSLNLFDTNTGRTVRRVPDVRIGDMQYGRPDDRHNAS